MVTASTSKRILERLVGHVPDETELRRLLADNQREARAIRQLLKIATTARKAESTPEETKR